MVPEPEQNGYFENTVMAPSGNVRTAWR